MASKTYRIALRPFSRPSGSKPHYHTPFEPRKQHRRPFHQSPRWAVVKPYLLADIGEGITECQIIQWFVQPGARVQQFDKICEVQSDKASVEITSRFDGVIKKLYYEADDMARVGKPLVDIDIQSDISPEDEALTGVEGDPKDATFEQSQPPKDPATVLSEGEASVLQDARDISMERRGSTQPQSPPSGKHATLATPAVRHMIKDFGLDITDICGTGKDGRVLKEDVQKYIAAQKEAETAPSPTQAFEPQAEDKTVPLTPIQNQMFKTMTRSLTIPHFLYTDNVDFSSLTRLRRKYNASASVSITNSQQPKISSLAFIIKAVSLSLHSFPIINAHLDTTTNASKPQLHLKGSHDIGIAVDSPSGLLVPVIRGVQNRSILSIASEIIRLSSLARSNKLSSADLSGATFTVSNIGSIGGMVVAPVIVPPQVAILGVGKARVVPAFDADGNLCKREECVFSWSADHRVADGAMIARCAEIVREYLEDIEQMVVRLR